MMSVLALRVCDDAGVDREILLRRPYAIVGPDQDSDLRLPDIVLKSPRRLYFHAVDEGVVSIDLSSPRRSKKAAPAVTNVLGKRECLKIGQYSVGAELRGPRATSAERLQRDFSVRRLPNKPREDIRLTFVNGCSRRGRKSQRFLRDTMTLIGSSSRCHLKLSHPTVPDFHASIVRTSDEIWIVALSRDCELQVNGRTVRHTRLSSGDIISIGPFLMQLQLDQPSDASTQLITREKAVRTIPSQRAESPSRRVAENAASSRTLRHGRDSSADGESTDLQAPDGQIEKRSEEWDTISCSSETDVVALVQQLTSLQQMLIEQSQQQTSLMIHLVGDAQAKHVTQEDLLREQIAAIQRIGDELRAWREGLENQVAAVPSSPMLQGPPTLPSITQQQYVARLGSVETGVTPDLNREPKSQEDIEAHSSLAERIGFLEKERNSLIQRIMRLLQGTQDSIA